jgi:predicted GNAT family acetyltransferase
MVMETHPLDRPAWTALTTRQRSLAVGDARVVRFRPTVNLFAAMAEDSPDHRSALSALVPPGGEIGLVERYPVPPLQDFTLKLQVPILQMVSTTPPPLQRAVGWVPLDDRDAAQMLALATLTRPGPFFAETHRMGDFIGIKEDGRLIAMAGQRMRVPGFTEVSAVCTHPDARGRGYAGALMAELIGRILNAGEAAFLHCYPDNPAFELYRALGLETRATMIYTVMER